MQRIKEAMLLLIANDAPLGPEWLDHALGGDWDGHRRANYRCIAPRSSLAPGDWSLSDAIKPEFAL
jgi:hypothetical protein